MTLLWGDTVAQDPFLMWPCHHQHMSIKFLPSMISSLPCHLQNCAFEEGDILLLATCAIFYFLIPHLTLLVSLWQTEAQNYLVCHWDSVMRNSTQEPLLTLREIRELLVEASLEILREHRGSSCSSTFPSPHPPQAMDVFNSSSGQA